MSKSDAASKPRMFLGFRTIDCLNAEWLTRKRVWVGWQWFRSLSTRDDQHRQEVPGEAKRDRFLLELTSTSRLLHLASLTLRTLYSYPVLRRQARCIHSLTIIWLWMCVSSSSRPVCDSCFLTMKDKDCSNLSSFLPYTSPERHGCSGLTLYWQSHLFLPETRQEGYLYTLSPLTNSKIKNIITTFSRELLTAVL